MRFVVAMYLVLALACAAMLFPDEVADFIRISLRSARLCWPVTVLTVLPAACPFVVGTLESGVNIRISCPLPVGSPLPLKESGEPDRSFCRQLRLDSARR